MSLRRYIFNTLAVVGLLLLLGVVGLWVDSYWYFVGAGNNETVVISSGGSFHLVVSTEPGAHPWTWGREAADANAKESRIELPG